MNMLLLKIDVGPVVKSILHNDNISCCIDSYYNVQCTSYHSFTPSSGSAMSNRSVQPPDDDVLLTILENGSVGYWDWNIPAGKSFQSPALKKMFGYEEHELDNSMDAVRKLVFSEDLARVDVNFNEHVKSHGAIPFSSEIRNHHKDGSTVWVLCKGKVIEWDNDGNPLRAVGCNIDITEQKLAQEALRRSEENYRSLINNIQDGIFQCDLKGNVIFSSPASARILGFASVDEMKKTNLTRDLYLHPKDHERLCKLLNEQGRVTDFEVELKLKDGSTVTIVSNCQYIRDLDGRITGIEGVLHDITERKRSEEAIKKSQSMLKNIYDATPIGLGVANGDTLVNVNNAFCTMVGYPEHDLIGQKLLFLYPDENEFNRIGDELRPQLAASGKGMVETTHRRSDGSMIDIILYVALFDKTDFSAGLVFSVIDISERKKMEHEKKHLEEMLLHSQKLESIGRLAGGIAHDFNNMLTAIMGNAEILKEQLPLASKAYSKLETIELAAESAANLTRQLLAFSRKQIIEPRIINLNATVEIIQKMLFTLIGENICLHINSAPELNTIIADPGQIEQIILNLTVNARDAMPSGGHLYIETKNVVLDEAYSQMHLNFVPGSYVMLAISDTGTGMSKDAIDHCFEPFFTTKGIGKGTGLGLATVYGNVKQIGGTIELYSELGRGTTFKLYFPAAQVPASEVESRTESVATLLGTETLLLVEDNAMVLKFSSEILTKAGYNVLIAATGEEALSLGQHYSSTIHLLITDVILPGINGRNTSEKLSELRPALRTLYTSGYTADVIGKQGIVEHGIDLISKPYTTQLLLSKVRSILDRK
jgi:two-component system, cell cycle sensor histidine kinase and response regulator CckA